MNKAIIFDRDGTLIEDKNFLKQKAEVVFYNIDLELMKDLNKTYFFFIVSNQSGISKNIISEQDVEEVNAYIADFFKKNNIYFENIYYCPHQDSDECNYKKPGTGFIDIIKQEYHITTAESFVIGDHPSDIQLAYNSGMQGIYLLTGHGEKHREELKKLNINNYLIKNNINKALNYINSEEI